MAAKKKGPDVHVVPHKKQFVVKEEGNPKPLTRPSTQQKSIDKAKPIAKKNRGEVVVHRPDGRIRDSDSFGRDPNPPKDRKH